MSGPMEIVIFASPKAKQKLDMESMEKQTNETREMAMEFSVLKSAEVG